MSRAETIGRWIVIVPAVVLGTLILRFVALIFGGLITAVTSSEASLFDQVLAHTASGVLLGFFPIQIAITIAPSRHRIVAITTTALMLVLSGVGLLASFVSGSGWGIFEDILMAIAALKTGYDVTDGISLRENSTSAKGLGGRNGEMKDVVLPVLNLSVAKCPYCSTILGATEVVVCPRCQSAHHAECWKVNENSCCTYACGVRAKA